MIYWTKTDGRIYCFVYTRLKNINVNHLPFYSYVGFKDNTLFNEFKKLKGVPKGDVVPDINTLTAEHQALEQQYGLLD